MDFNVTITPTPLEVDLSVGINVIDVSLDIIIDNTSIPIDVIVNDTNISIDVIIDSTSIPVDVIIAGTELSVDVITGGTDFSVDVITSNYGVDKYYRHSQDASSATWTIVHNLNKRPSVTVTDSAGTTVEGEAQYVDSNNLKIYFSAPFSGYAELN